MIRKEFLLVGTNIPPPPHLAPKQISVDLFSNFTTDTRTHKLPGKDEKPVK